ncbi:hypothetical protein [Alishewanella tabrizica]|uniref:Transmembrane protein n=1 Tax=Alishewanella tabrizica TaxID=671278 RepID=A0ABQ2WVJ4_9ALTE|nr:hypothetical protein [Alishewanella tabrizica]GGW70790.1 hypothetical protein GCM10008111_28560 [Alishewanella tabrizica]
MTAERKHKEVKNTHSTLQCVAASGASSLETKTAKSGTHVQKIVSQTVIRKRRSDDFWINIGVVFFISVCLIILSWDVLLMGM